MAGMPVRRQKLKAAESTVEDLKKELQATRLTLVRKGLDPEEFGLAAVAEAPQLTAYDPALPGRISQLANEGQSIEEIRVLLGFSEAQERDWAHSYVDFAGALIRIRAREEAFWQGQARLAVTTGDRAAFNSVTALIERRFNSNSAAGNALDLVVVHIGQPLVKPVVDEG